MRKMTCCGLLVFLAAVPVLAHDDDDDDDKDSRVDAALRLSTGGYVDTGFRLSRIDGREHSLSLRFLLQYPNSYYNAILGESGGGLLFIGKSSAQSHGRDVPFLDVNYGGGRAAYYASPSADPRVGFVANRWYHLVVTVSSRRKVRVYVDGRRPFRDPPDLSHVLPPTSWATGRLRFGERNSSQALPEQFYGLLDDVAVWDHALSHREARALARHPKLTGKEEGLLAGWNFDFGGRPRKHKGRLAFHGDAQRVFPGPGQNWPDLLVPANHTTQYSLPLAGTLQVVQGSDSEPDGSHRGYASFAFDLVPGSGPARGAEVRAMAPGRVVFVRDTSPDDEPNQKVPGCQPCDPSDPDDASCVYLPNVVILEHAPGEYSENIHLQRGSIPSSIHQKLLSGELVERGELIGQVGRSGTGGDHLHFGHLWKLYLTDGEDGSSPGQDTPHKDGCGYDPAVKSPNLLTRPFVFHEFQLQRNGSPWRDAIDEAPRTGDLIRPRP